MKQMSKDELDHIDQELKEEVIRARLKIEELQKTKKVVKQIHDNACSLLGVKSAAEPPSPPDTNIEVKDNGHGEEDGEKRAVLHAEKQTAVESNWTGTM